MEFTKLDSENIPDAWTLVWRKRKSGKVCLATRRNRSLAPEGGEAWDYCWWYGFPENGGIYTTDGWDMVHQTNFSDVTVDSWKYVEAPLN